MTQEPQSGENLQWLAQIGSVENVKDLLIKHGNEPTTDPRYSALDWITSGVNSCEGPNSKSKKALVAAFRAKIGIFAEKQEVKPDYVAEFNTVAERKPAASQPQKTSGVDWESISRNSYRYCF